MSTFKQDPQHSTTTKVVLYNRATIPSESEKRLHIRTALLRSLSHGNKFLIPSGTGTMNDERFRVPSRNNWFAPFYRHCRLEEFDESETFLGKEWETERVLKALMRTSFSRASAPLERGRGLQIFRSYETARRRLRVFHKRLPARQRAGGTHHARRAISYSCS